MKLIQIAAALAASILAASPAAAATWDMATPYPDFEFHTRNIRQFAEDVKAATGGKLEIKVHSAQSLIKHPEIKNAVRSGQVPIGELLLSRLSNEAPIYELDAIPFLASSYTEAKKLWEVQRPKIEELFAKQNLRILFVVPWPPQGLYAKKAIESTADLQGLRFRTYNSVTERMARLLSMVPTQTEATEMATAFITGRVDAMMTSPSGGAQNKAWDWSTHFYDVQGWLPKNVVAVNEDAFKALDEATRAGLLKAAAAAEQRGWTMSEADKKEGVDLLVKGGMKGIEPSPKLVEGLKAVGRTMTDDWLKKGGAEGEAVIAKYRASLGQ
jgi:TRAP-type C4-dicarboxylate transport system substrate-binding protein